LLHSETRSSIAKVCIAKNQIGDKGALLFAEVLA
jgi:Ran GTPase-activating protein (RanGAP) involved in mRNA processing and transport